MRKRKPIQKVQPIYIEPMVWAPGRGADVTRLTRLKNIFPKPQEPLERWSYSGELMQTYDDLNKHGIEGTQALSVWRCTSDLIFEMMDGPDWRELPTWYAYFFPRLLDTERFPDLDWFEFLCQGLMLLSICHPDDEVTRFEIEFAEVLVPWMMEGHFWERDKFVPLQTGPEWQARWIAINVHAEISVAFFMAWRYLPPHALSAWLRSVIAIKDMIWRAHFLDWLLKVWPIFEHGAATLSILGKGKIKFDDLWSGSYQLFSGPINTRESWALIPTENIAALHAAIRQEFNSHTYFAWIDQFAADADLWTLLDVRLRMFQDKYL